MGLHPNAELAFGPFRWRWLPVLAATRFGATRNAGGSSSTPDRGNAYTAGSFTGTVPPVGDSAVDGSGRVMFRQRRGGGVLLFA